MLSIFSGSMVEIVTFPALLFFALTALVHIIFANAVGNDADNFIRNGQPTQLVGPRAWALAILLGGVFVAAIYWLIHHSTLRR